MRRPAEIVLEILQHHALDRSSYCCSVEIVNRLANATTLRWRETDDKSVSGYRIAMRRTHEPEWTHFRTVNRVTRVEIPESKDDWVFAVQAVTTDDERSLPTFAVPAARR